MRILCVVPEYPPHAGGGMARYYKTLLPELTRLGHEVRVVVAAPFSPAFPSYDHEGVAVECVPAERIQEQARRFAHLGPTPHLRRYLGAAWAAWEHAKARCRFDVVEVADWGLLFAPWISEEVATPISVTLHGSAGQIDLHDRTPGLELEGTVLRLLEAALLPAADDLVTYGGGNARAWEQIAGRAVRLIPPPLRLAEALASEDTAMEGGLVVARVQHWKGPHVLCEALRLRPLAGPIRWVGRDMPYGTHASLSRMLAQRYPDVWGTRIEPVGPRTPEETAALERSAAFLVVPSLWDVFNLVTAEGLGWARVVIVSSGAGASELVTHGVDGFVYPAGDAARLAELLEQVAAMGGPERREIGGRGRELVVRRLDPEGVGRLRADAYAGIVERRRDTARPGARAWAREAVQPDRNVADGLGFLDHVGLRELATHAAGRVLKRVRARVGPLAGRLRGGGPAHRGR